MMPRTHHNMSAMECLSGMQKCIRRNCEYDAMLFACELLHTSKAYCTMVCNRLEIISHEDIDTQHQPWIPLFVNMACTQARAWYDPKKLGKARMALGNAIRMLCRATKSREGDHFQASVGLHNLLEDYIPEIQDWMLDQHTAQGKRMGRGLEHFREVSTQLVPKSKRKDEYEDEAFRLWELKQKKGK